MRTQGTPHLSLLTLKLEIRCWVSCITRRGGRQEGADETKEQVEGSYISVRHDLSSPGAPTHHVFPQEHSSLHLRSSVTSIWKKKKDPLTTAIQRGLVCYRTVRERERESVTALVSVLHDCHAQQEVLLWHARDWRVDVLYNGHTRRGLLSQASRDLQRLTWIYIFRTWLWIKKDNLGKQQRQKAVHA